VHTVHTQYIWIASLCARAVHTQCSYGLCPSVRAQCTRSAVMDYVPLCARSAHAVQLWIMSLCEHAVHTQYVDHVPLSARSTHAVCMDHVPLCARSAHAVHASWITFLSVRLCAHAVHTQYINRVPLCAPLCARSPHAVHASRLCVCEYHARAVSEPIISPLCVYTHPRIYTHLMCTHISACMHILHVCTHPYV
jgi:hypothetical protein